MAEDPQDFRIIGRENRILYDRPLTTIEENPGSLEEYLVKAEVNWFHKIFARIFGRIFLGNYKTEWPGGGYAKYYVAWCEKHNKYFVAKPRGYNMALDCPTCLEDFIEASRNLPITLQKRNFRLIKSDKT